MSHIPRGYLLDRRGCSFLPKRVGSTNAKDVAFSARDIEAIALAGIADSPDLENDLVLEVRAWVARFANNFSFAGALGAAALDRTFERALDVTFNVGNEAQTIYCSSHAHRGAIQNFLDGMRYTSQN